MRCPFGETGPTGEMPPLEAEATAASARAPASGVTRRSSLRRTDGWHSTKVAGEARVEVPPYVTGEFEGFVNGVPPDDGRGYKRAGRSLDLRDPVHEDLELAGDVRRDL